MQNAIWPCLCLLCACSATPSRPDALGSPRGLWERFLSPNAIGNDLTAIAAHTGSAASHELARAANLPHHASGFADRELARGVRLPAAPGSLAGEMERLGEATASARLLARDLAGDPIQALAVAPDVADIDRPPMSEQDDRRHRTDPADDRPEASFWDRLRRRLRL